MTESLTTQPTLPPCEEPPQRQVGPDYNEKTAAPTAAHTRCEEPPRQVGPDTIGYVRVSTDRQDTDRQIAAIKRYAEIEGLNLLMIIEEESGISGRSAAVKNGPAAALSYYADLAGEKFGTIEREGYGQMLRLVATGSCKIVVFAALDRFSRDCIELLLLERLLAKYGV